MNNKNIYSLVLEDSKLKAILTVEQKEIIKALEYQDYKNSYTFKDLFIKLDKELKIEYPNNFLAQDLNVNYLIGRMGFQVIEIFTSIEPLQWEREKVYQWHDIVLNEVSENALNLMIKCFKIDMLS